MERSQNPYRYCTLGFDIIIFFGLGFILGPELIGSELIGALIGAIVGTFVMWIHLWLIIRRMDRTQKETERHE
ncbi:MAG: hypothetical protein ACXACA_05335 [Candidatus Ranarchaeia archaeon]